MNWGDLVERIRAGEAAAELELYKLVWGKGRFTLARKLGHAHNNIEDRLHDLYLSLLGTIRGGRLEHPEVLGVYINSALNTQAANLVSTLVKQRERTIPLDDPPLQQADYRKTPEELAIRKQERDLMFRILKGLRPVDREILFRFYVDEQDKERICREMDVTADAFRLLKSRAKEKFAERGKKLQQRPFLRWFESRSAAAPVPA